MVKKLRKTWENPWDLYGIYGFHHKNHVIFLKKIEILPAQK
jgi:hypothetical protein